MQFARKLSRMAVKKPAIKIPKIEETLHSFFLPPYWFFFLQGSGLKESTTATGKSRF